MKNERRASFSVMNATQGSKVRLLKLNIPTACPPRVAVPVNSKKLFGVFFNSQYRVQTSVRDATAATMKISGWTGIGIDVNSIAPSKLLDEMLAASNILPPKPIS